MIAFCKGAEAMPRWQPVELTPHETERLIQTLLQGQRPVTEADCVTLLRWATEQRFGALLVEMMIAGEMRPVVEGQEVTVALPSPTAP
jgi:hypothetical protein